MKPLVLIYWIRLALGIVAALISTIVATMLNETAISTFVNSLTIALLVYLISYYILKAKFLSKVEKQSKIMTMGIGIYFFTWIVFLVLFYTVWYSFWRVPPV